MEDVQWERDLHISRLQFILTGDGEINTGTERESLCADLILLPVCIAQLAGRAQPLDVDLLDFGTVSLGIVTILGEGHLPHVLIRGEDLVHQPTDERPSRVSFVGHWLRLLWLVFPHDARFGGVFLVSRGQVFAAYGLRWGV